MAGRTAGDIEAGLRSWANARFGGEADVCDVRNLGGHSGDTFGFRLAMSHASDDLVVRVAPAGVAHKGSTDVLRQAPLLRVLHARGVKVAAVRAAEEDARFFGAPFLIVEKLPGRPLTMGPDAEQWLPPLQRQRAHELALDALAAIHAVDAAALSSWETQRSPEDEIEFWASSFSRAPETDWAHAGAALRDALRATLPERFTLGVCHGDFQTNNVLYVATAHGIDVGGVVDWEVAHLGAVEHDLAWFLMMNDPGAWDRVEQRGGVDLASLIDRYETITQRPLYRLAWFQALACYRIAAIACYNIRLHRSGKRLDPAWERCSSSTPRFFARAHELLGQAA